GRWNHGDTKHRRVARRATRVAPAALQQPGGVHPGLARAWAQFLVHRSRHLSQAHPPEWRPARAPDATRHLPPAGLGRRRPGPGRGARSSSGGEERVMPEPGRTTPADGHQPWHTILSLGAGVQSTTLALLAAGGELALPEAAIFADTGWEPRAG